MSDKTLLERAQAVCDNARSRKVLVAQGITMVKSYDVDIAELAEVVADLIKTLAASGAKPTDGS